MKVALRIASNPRRGRGHLTRCDALIGALAARGARLTIALDPVSPAQSWSADPEAILRESSEDSVDELDTLLKRGSHDLLVIDSYDIPVATRSRLARRARLVEILDRPAAAQGDIVINPSLGALPPEEFGARPTTVLSGPQFILLRAAFRNRRAQTAARLSGSACLAFGAFDSVDWTGRTIAALSEVRALRRLTVILGGQAPHLAAVERALRNLPIETEFRVDDADAGAAFAASEIVVAAAGVTLVEAMCCGAAVVCVAAAENQSINAAAASAAGAAIVVSAFDDAPAGLAAQVQSLLADHHARAELARRGQALVDGLGADRVAERLVSLPTAENAR